MSLNYPQGLFIFSHLKAIVVKGEQKVTFLKCRESAERYSPPIWKIPVNSLVMLKLFKKLLHYFSKNFIKSIGYTFKDSEMTILCVQMYFSPQANVTSQSLHKLAHEDLQVNSSQRIRVSQILQSPALPQEDWQLLAIPDVTAFLPPADTSNSSWPNKS